jgi:hypothetical protein
MGFLGQARLAGIAGGVVAAVALGLALPVQAQQVSGVLPEGGGVDALGQLDAASQSAILGAIVQALDQRALRRDNLFYVAFRLLGPPPQTAQPGGFAPPLVPQGAPPLAEGIMEITMFTDPRATFYPVGSAAELSGSASFRIFQFRLWSVDQGWQGPQLVTLHFWEWGGTIRDGRFDLALNTAYQGRFANPDAMTEFVASVFNVDPQTVEVGRPSEEQTQQALP